MRVSSCPILDVAEPGNYGHCQIDRGQFDNAELLFNGPVKAPETTPPLSGTGTRNLPSLGVSRLLEDRFKKLRWVQR